MRAFAAVSLAGAALTGSPMAAAGVVFGLTGTGLEGAVVRWDAAPLTFSGQERSLVGGLRYAVSGGSLQAFRDQFSWSSTPSVPAFGTAVQQAFDAWGSTDPASGRRAPLSFSFDAATPVVFNSGGGSANFLGAEIDIVAAIDANNWNPGNTGTQGETWWSSISQPVTLTSGVAGYSFSAAIVGADIFNPGAVYSLDLFRRLLTHEIGHALGLGDAETSANPGVFIDDNFAGVGSAASTLNNSWASLVNRTDPAHSSGLARFNIGSATTVSGVNLLMESNGLGIAAGNPVTSLVPLTNDEYGTLQFLYPDPAAAVPEASMVWQWLLGLSALAWLRRRDGSRAQASRV